MQLNYYISKCKIHIGLQTYYKKIGMVIKQDKHRFVVIIEKDIFEKFKIAAADEKRSASNLAAKLINDYVKKHTN